MSDAIAGSVDDGALAQPGRPAAKDAYQARRLWVVTHRWMGLTLGLVLVLLGVTGSIAVFWRELDMLVRPELRVPTPPAGSQMLSLDEIYGVLKAAHPHRPKPWTLELPFAEGYPVYGVYSRPEEQGGLYNTNLHVALDPYTGEILSTWLWGSTAVSWLYDLHANLQLGLFGHKTVGVFAVVLLISTLTGLYVWWPTGRFAKRHFKVNARAGASRLELDLHRAAGFYSLLLMGMFAITGYMFIYPQHGAALVRRFTAMAPPTPSDLHGGHEAHGTGGKGAVAQDTRYPHSVPRAGVPPMNIREAVERAQRLFPTASLKKVSTPAGEHGVYGVVMRHSAETFHKTYPKTEVWMDQYDGRVIVTSDPTKETLGQRFLKSPLPFHNGEAAGLGGRIVVFIAGFVPLLLYVTGFLQWRRRSKLSSRAPRPAS